MLLYIRHASFRDPVALYFTIPDPPPPPPPPLLLTQSVRRSFDDLLEQTGWRLTRLHEVRAQKQYLRLLGSLPGYLDRLEALLSSTDDQDTAEQVRNEERSR